MEPLGISRTGARAVSGHKCKGRTRVQWMTCALKCVNSLVSALQGLICLLTVRCDEVTAEEKLKRDDEGEDEEGMARTPLRVMSFHRMAEGWKMGARHNGQEGKQLHEESTLSHQNKAPAAWLHCNLSPNLHSARSKRISQLWAISSRQTATHPLASQSPAIIDIECHPVRDVT